jgi:hypothetical protein
LNNRVSTLHDGPPGLPEFLNVLWLKRKEVAHGTRWQGNASESADLNLLDVTVGLAVFVTSSSVGESELVALKIL